MATERKPVKLKLGLAELAKELGSLSETARNSSYSRDGRYRVKAWKTGVELEKLLITPAGVLERTKTAVGGTEMKHPGYLGVQDTFLVGTFEAIGRVYQQTFLDAYSRVAVVKLYSRRSSLAAADLLNDRVMPFFEAHGLCLLRVLTDRGNEYCGAPEHCEYELYLELENIEHTYTKAGSLPKSGLCERFHKVIFERFYRLALREKRYNSLEELQVATDAWLQKYNESRPNRGGSCHGKTPLRTFLDSVSING